MADNEKPNFYNMFLNHTIVESIDITDPIQKDGGISVYMAWGKDRSKLSPLDPISTQFPDGEFATWIISNDFPDRQFRLKDAEYITNEFGSDYAYKEVQKAYQERTNKMMPKSLTKDEIFDALMNMDTVFCKDNRTLYMLEFGTDGNPLAVRRYTVSVPYKDFAQKVKDFWDALHRDGEDPSRDCLSYWAEKTFVEDLGFGHFEAGELHIEPLNTDFSGPIVSLKDYIADKIRFAGGLSTDAVFVRDSKFLVEDLYAKAGINMNEKEYVVQSTPDDFKGLPRNYYTANQKDAEMFYQAESKKGYAVTLLHGEPGHYDTLQRNYFVCDNRIILDSGDFIEDMNNLLREHLPSGSGFNNSWDIDLVDKKFWCESVYEHMNDAGMYDRNIDFVVEIPLDNPIGFEVSVPSEKDRKFAESDDLISYFEDTIAEHIRPVVAEWEERFRHLPEVEYGRIYAANDTLRFELSNLHTAQHNDLDFDQRYLVGSGSSSCATADSLREIDQYLSEQSIDHRHFCKIYDHETNLMIDGSDYLMSKYDGSDRWRPWSFTHYFKNEAGCVILEQKDIISLADQEKGIKQSLVLGNWNKNDAMPDGEYATWIATNDTPDKSFILRAGNMFPTVFYDSVDAALKAAKSDFIDRFDKETERIKKENEAVKSKGVRGFSQ